MGWIVKSGSTPRWTELPGESEASQLMAGGGAGEQWRHTPHGASCLPHHRSPVPPWTKLLFLPSPWYPPSPRQA
jgi:hypothetical protein